MNKIFTSKKIYQMLGSQGPAQKQKSPGGFDGPKGNKISKSKSKRPATANDSLASSMAHSYKSMDGGKGVRGNWSRINDSVKANYPKIDGSKINIMDLQGRTNAKQARAKYDIPARKPGEKR